MTKVMDSLTMCSEHFFQASTVDKHVEKGGLNIHDVASKSNVANVLFTAADGSADPVAEQREPKNDQNRTSTPQRSSSIERNHGPGKKQIKKSRASNRGRSLSPPKTARKARSSSPRKQKSKIERFHKKERSKSPRKGRFADACRILPRALHDSAATQRLRKKLFPAKGVTRPPKGREKSRSKSRKKKPSSEEKPLAKTQGTKLLDKSTIIKKVAETEKSKKKSKRETVNAKNVARDVRLQATEDVEAIELTSYRKKIISEDDSTLVQEGVNMLNGRVFTISAFEKAHNFEQKRKAATTNKGLETLF